MNMLHEIQAGDVVIVTVPSLEGPNDNEVRLKTMQGLLNHLFTRSSGARCSILSGGETSVHVIRAKAEAKPGNGPPWRNGNVEKPPIGSNVLYWSIGNKVACVHYDVQPHDVFNTHWMPLPEGPQ